MLVLAFMIEIEASGESVWVGRDVELQIQGADVVAGGAGDFNGDGARDLLLGDCGASDSAGAVHVIFGPFDSEGVDVSALGERGFRIDGASGAEESPGGGDRACWPEAAGDVNGDGRDDILVGAPYTTYKDTYAGTVYIVFGKDSSESVDLERFDQGLQLTEGYRIDGPGSSGFTGTPNNFSALGDVNSDGLSDVVVTAPFYGSTYVVYGKRDPSVVDLAVFHFNETHGLGYRIATKAPSHNSGYAASGAGDVNADGIPDVAVGVVPRLGSVGFAYVVFGKADSTTPDVDHLEGKGFKIVGTFGGSQTGAAVAGAGDVNGDGLGDVLVGSDPLCCGAGEAHVVFGKKASETVRLARLGRHGFRMDLRTERQAEGIGYDVAGLGDVDDDGLSDVIIGAPSRTSRNRKWSGAAYVVYGRKASTRVPLDDLRGRGFRIDGRRRDALGARVGGPGDLNGDGSPDIILGSVNSVTYGLWGGR